MLDLRWDCHLALGIHKPLDQQAAKGVTLLAGMVNPDYQGEIVLLEHSGGKDHIQNTGVVWVPEYFHTQ